MEDPGELPISYAFLEEEERETTTEPLNNLHQQEEEEDGAFRDHDDDDEGETTNEPSNSPQHHHQHHHHHHQQQQELQDGAIDHVVVLEVVIGGRTTIQIRLDGDLHRILLCCDFFRTEHHQRFELPNRDPKEWPIITRILDPLDPLIIDSRENAALARPWFVDLGYQRGVEACDIVLMACPQSYDTIISSNQYHHHHHQDYGCHCKSMVDILDTKLMVALLSSEEALAKSTTLLKSALEKVAEKLSCLHYSFSPSEGEEALLANYLQCRRHYSKTEDIFMSKAAMTASTATTRLKSALNKVTENIFSSSLSCSGGGGPGVGSGGNDDTNTIYNKDTNTTTNDDHSCLFDGGGDGDGSDDTSTVFNFDTNTTNDDHSCLIGMPPPPRTPAPLAGTTKNGSWFETIRHEILQDMELQYASEPINFSFGDI